MGKQIGTAITIIGIAVVLALLGWRTRDLDPLTSIRIVGAVLALLAYVCWATARLQLGKSFSVRAKATELVTHGIYAKIRNPVYVFGTLFIAGMILWVRQPKWLLILLLIIPMQIIRARKEAQVLEAKFGDAYRAYRAKTWF